MQPSGSRVEGKKSSIKEASSRVYVRRVNAEVSAVGTIIDIEIGDGASKGRMDRLKELAALFDRDPTNLQVKNEYRALLKEHFGRDADAVKLRDIEYMKTNYEFKNNVQRNQTQSPSPNRLYPYDREMPHLRSVKHKYRVPSPPAHMIRIKRNSVSPVSQATAENRRERLLAANSKGI